MARVGLWHNVCVENYALLKLLDKNRELTYEQYHEFCMEEDSDEECEGVEAGNVLTIDFENICQERGFRTKRKYLYDEVARARRLTEAKIKEA